MNDQTPLGHTLLQYFEHRVNHGDLLVEVLYCHWYMYVALHYLYKTMYRSPEHSLHPTAAI